MAPLKLISSRSTFVNKWVFPILWFGFLTSMTGIILFAGDGPQRPPRAAVLIPLAMMGFGYLLMRKLVFDLVDEVLDAGSELLVMNRGREIRIPLTEIVNVNHSATRPERVTLFLRQPTALGQEITFVPPLRLLPFGRHPLVDDLIRRVDAARRG